MILCLLFRVCVLDLRVAPKAKTPSKRNEANFQRRSEEEIKAGASDFGVTNEFILQFIYS